MSEKCVHNWYSRLAGLGSYEYFCLACGKKLTITGMDVYATELEARIAELEAESERFTVHSRIKRQDDKWIPVSERLPEKQKLTIGFTDNSAYVFFEIVNDDEMGLVMYPYQNRKGTVTHWMPLPSTPEVQE